MPEDLKSTETNTSNENDESEGRDLKKPITPALIFSALT